MNEILKKTTTKFETMKHISAASSIGCCLMLSIAFVASLYVWKSEHNRDHPDTVKRRFLSVIVMMIFSTAFVYLLTSSELLEQVAFNELLGLRLNGLVNAIFIPFLLTMLLFLGPIIEEVQKASIYCFWDCKSWKNNIPNIIWVRNHIIAPLSEEFVYRACMIPLMLQNFSPIAAVFITPLFFGTAHVHHIIERRDMGMQLKTAILLSCFQMLYTTMFGIYSAYLFVRTGHFVAPFLVHALCNHMGVPNIQALWERKALSRILLIISYVVGLFGWIILLPVATDPKLYDNNLFWYL